MPLNRRQQVAYQHTIDLYRPLEPIGLDPDGGVWYPSWEKHPAYRDVKCLRSAGRQSMTQTPAGRMHTDSSGTWTLNMAEDQEVGDRWLVRYTGPGQDNGTYAVVQGIPANTPDIGRRRANLLVVNATPIPRPEGFP